MQCADLSGGFTDAPRDAAHAFRAAMGAMARPGRLHDVTGAVPPAPLSVAAGVLILTLCDPETPLYLAGAHDRAAVRDWVRFHTGAPVTGAADCVFAVGDWAAVLPLATYRTGTPEYPDRSATLIVEMPHLSNTGAILTGPGIRDQVRFSLPDKAAFVVNARAYPLGLDFYFTAGALLAALPRSTKVS